LPGLQEQHDCDLAFIYALLQCMDRDRVDFTIAFRRLGEFSSRDNPDTSPLGDLFMDRGAFDARETIRHACYRKTVRTWRSARA
jgi:uncharacterized protein YdiU (UPF0061 family)